jgi:hypothetical protein
MVYRWPASPRARIGVRQDQQQHIFRPEHIRGQWTYVFFNHVRQGTEATREHRVHHPVFARCIESGVGPVFGVRKPICPCIAIGPAGVRVFVWGRPRTMGRGGIEPHVESGNEQAFGRTVDRVSMAARSHWHRYPAFDAGQPDVGEGRRGRRGWSRGVCPRG